MAAMRYIIVVFILLLFPFSSLAQELEMPRLGTFQVEKNTIPEMQDMWKRNNFNKINHTLRLPSVTSKNYRTPVDMASVVAGIERGKKARRNQDLIDNIRVSYGSYQKDGKKGSFSISPSIHTKGNSNMPFGTCVHGYTERYCSICSPQSRFGNFGHRNYGHGNFGRGIYGHPQMQSFYIP